MSPLLLSLAAGVLIGLFYGLLNVRSPAPPAIALVGLLGMLLGGALMQTVIPSAHATVLQPLSAQPETHLLRTS